MDEKKEIRTVKVNGTRSSDLSEQLGLLYSIFQGKPPGENLKFNLSQLKWVCPLLILPISAYISTTHSEYDLEGCETESYLRTMGFPIGVDSIESFEKTNSSYIPITVFKKEAGIDRDKLEALFGNKIFKLLGNVEGTIDAIRYPISELVGNIFDHSKKDIGFICAQVYPQKQYLDVCIVDCGRGFAKAYAEDLGQQYSDQEALKAALEGESIKPDPNHERGTGLRTSKDIICKEMKGGSFILISGGACVIIEDNKETPFLLPQFYWQGAIIAFRIPKPSGPIDIYKIV